MQWIVCFYSNSMHQGILGKRCLQKVVTAMHKVHRFSAASWLPQRQLCVATGDVTHCIKITRTACLIDVPNAASLIQQQWRHLPNYWLQRGRVTSRDRAQNMWKSFATWHEQEGKEEACIGLSYTVGKLLKRTEWLYSSASSEIRHISVSQRLVNKV